MEYRICLYTTSWGRCYISEYIDSLLPSKAELFSAVQAKLNRAKVPQNHRMPLVKPVTGHRYKEIRPGGKNTARLFFVIEGNDIVLLLHGYTKKEERLKPSELAKADKILKDYKNGGGTYEEFEF